MKWDPEGDEAKGRGLRSGRGLPIKRSTAIWIPMKWDPEGDEAKGRGLEIKQYQAQ